MQTVIFDLDGTLVDSIRDIKEAVNDTLKAFAFPLITEEQAKSYLGKGSRVLLERAAKTEISEEMLQFYLNSYEKNLIVYTVPYEGIQETLQALKETSLLAVLSNKPHHLTKTIIDHFFPDTFNLVLGERGIRKPDPSGVYEILDYFNSTKDETYLVGDSETDRLTAQNAGIHLIQVGYGFQENDGLMDPKSIPDILRRNK
ncbi:HAD family hydrolase [Guggenheimella bovis]